jgi:hypothetical protein
MEGYPQPLKNAKAKAVFDAIHAAFNIHSQCPADCRWMTDPDMVSMLAACASVLLEHLRGGGPEREIPWENHGAVLRRTVRGFMTTLVVAIRRGGTHQPQGQTYFRSFAVPAWFVAWAEDEQNVDLEGAEFYPTGDEFIRSAA